VSGWEVLGLRDDELAGSAPSVGCGSEPLLEPEVSGWDVLGLLASDVLGLLGCELVASFSPLYWGAFSISSFNSFAPGLTYIMGP
jgi:hypothetical protein